jgi:hypothetical protein
MRRGVRAGAFANFTVCAVLAVQRFFNVIRPAMVHQYPPCCSSELRRGLRSCMPPRRNQSQPGHSDFSYM